MIRARLSFIDLGGFRSVFSAVSRVDHQVRLRSSHGANAIGAHDSNV
jgi:hypothetical protein